MGVSRGQSETVGVVLLTAVIVITSTVVGAFLLADFQSRAEDTPNADIESDVTAETIELRHRGGDSFDPAQVRVVVRDDSDERQYTLGQTFNESSGDNSMFEPGQRWRRNLTAEGDDPLSGEVSLLVVDEDSNRLIHESSTVIESEKRLRGHLCHVVGR